MSRRTANAAHSQSVEPLVWAMTAVLGLVWMESRIKVMVVVVKGVQRTTQRIDALELGSTSEPMTRVLYTYPKEVVKVLREARTRFPKAAVLRRAAIDPPPKRQAPYRDGRAHEQDVSYPPSTALFMTHEARKSKRPALSCEQGRRFAPRLSASPSGQRRTRTRGFLEPERQGLSSTRESEAQIREPSYSAYTTDLILSCMWKEPRSYVHEMASCKEYESREPPRCE